MMRIGRFEIGERRCGREKFHFFYCPMLWEWRRERFWFFWWFGKNGMCVSKRKNSGEDNNEG